MPNHTFYIPPSSIEGNTATLTGDELKHARTTLRLGEGDVVSLVDGVGGRYSAAFSSINSKEGILSIKSSGVETAPGFSLVMALGIVPGERFEWAIQKATELGVTGFIPLITERTETKIKGPWKRMDRLQRIIISSCKQCERAHFPALHPPAALEDLDAEGFDAVLAFWESVGTPPLTEVAKRIPRPQTCLVVIGPVGGFSTGEAAFLKKKGALLVGMGPRILRTETAAAAAATLLQYVWGDMG